MIVAKYNLRSANYSRGWVVTCEDGCGGECGIQDAEKEYFTPTVQLCTEVESSKQALEPAEKSRGPIPRFDVPAFKIVEKDGVRFSRVSGFDYDQCFDNGADVPAINDIAVDTAERASVGDINRDELRLWTVAFINSVYAMAQLVASVHFNSLAMRADAFHTMSDVLAAAIAARCARLRRRIIDTPKRGSSVVPALPFGYARAEVIGALVNNVALVALCLYLALAALPRIIDPEAFEPSWIYVGVAAAGVGVNLLAAAVMLCCRAIDAPPVGVPCAHGCEHYQPVAKQISSSSTSSPSSLGARKAENGGAMHGEMSITPVLMHSLFDAVGCLFVALMGLGVLLARGSRGATSPPLLALADPLVTLLLLVFLARAAFVGGERAVRVLLESAPESLADQSPAALTAALNGFPGEEPRVERLIMVQLDGAGAVFAAARLVVKAGSPSVVMASLRERVARALRDLGAIEAVVQVHIEEDSTSTAPVATTG